LYDTFGRLPRDDIKLRRILEQNAGAAVVVYSWDEYSEEAALGEGAVAYLHKGLTAAELASAVVAIHRGVAVSSVSLESRPSSAPADPMISWPGQDTGLTSRESEILTLITRGLSNEEITERAYLSINTVKSYIRSTYRKIGVKTRAQAVAWAYRHGFESTDDTGV
jgi:DNA-binding NarL/FixJ family response regulator